MLRISAILLALSLPAAALAQPVVPGQPLGQPVGPQDSDILRRSNRSLLTDPPPTPAPPPAASGAPNIPGATARQVAITPELCQQLSIQHVPAPDVTYRPGSDVYGRPVAPADLPNTNTNYGGIGSTTSTDILMRPQAGGLNQRGGAIGETYVGRVTVDANGHVAINGQPVDAASQADYQRDLQRRCTAAGY